MIGLTRYLATYWVEEGVRCNAMCPGGVEDGQPEDFLQKVILFTKNFKYQIVFAFFLIIFAVMIFLI